MKIRTQLWFVFTWSTLLPLAVVGVIAYNVSRTRLLAQADGNLAAAAHRVAQEFESFILRAEEGLRADGLVPQFAEFLALEPAERAGRETSIRQLLVNAIANDPVNITVARLMDRAGRTICQTGQHRVAASGDLPRWVADAMASGLPVAMLGDDGDHDAALWVAAPVRDAGGGVVGCLSLRYELTALQQIVAQASRVAPAANEGRYAVLLDATGRVLANGADHALNGTRWPPVRTDRPRAPGEEFIGYGIHSDQAQATGESDRVVQVPLGRTPWWVAVVSPAATHESAVRELRDVMLLLCGLGLVLGVGATALVAHRFSRPLMTLVEAARKMGRGDFEVVVPPVRRGELGVLVDAFNRMTMELRTTLRILEERIAEVRRSEETLAQLIAFSPVAIAEHTNDQRTLSLNAKFQELFGYTMADIPSVDVWWPLAYPDEIYRREVRTEWERLLAEAARRGGEASPMEANVRAASGSCLHIEFRARQIGDRWVTIFLDLTDRVREEETRRRLEDQLRQAQKLEAVGTLAGGIAHDFNNVLIGIMGNNELALSRLQGNDHVKEFLHDALAACGRARELVARILMFARQAEVDLQPVRIGAVVAEAARLLRASLPAEVAIEVVLADPDPAVLCDPIQIHQIVMNLGLNAAHAMPAGGILQLSLSRVTVTPADQECHPQLREQHTVKLSVRDDGVGMDAATLSRVFEPFFTTKQVGEGTGLGLAVVHGILRMLDAAAVITSAPGQGTTFDLYFEGGEDAPALPPVESSLNVVGRGQTLLLVDDEEAVLRAMQRLLSTVGFRVEAFQQPAEALAAVATGAVKPAGVISDVSMPGMNGVQLAAALRGQKLTCPILLITGNSLMLDRTLLGPLGIAEVLEKPLSLSELSAALARVLGDLEPVPD